MVSEQLIPGNRANGAARGWCVLALALLGILPVSAQLAEDIDPRMAGVSVTEKLGEYVPLGLEFNDEHGNRVSLRDLWTDDRPVILTLNYYTCTTLCTLTLNGLVRGLEGVDFVPGEDYEIITVSINPVETPDRALAKKGNYLTLFEGDERRRAGAEAGWHFLTGEEESIRELASAVGFAYRYDEESGQYLHRSVVMFCASDGKLVRYLGGVAFEPRTMRLALLEAAAGTIGSKFDQLFLFCFHYDALTGRYAPVAFNVMRVGGVITILLIGALILRLLWRDSRRRMAAAAAEEGSASSDGSTPINTSRETLRESAQARHISGAAPQES